MQMVLVPAQPFLGDPGKHGLLGQDQRLVMDLFRGQFRVQGQGMGTGQKESPTVHRGQGNHLVFSRIRRPVD